MTERTEFDLRALYAALDEQRCGRGLSWAAAAREINRFERDVHPIAVSTIRGIETRAVAEGDGILQMLLWLGRAPESFVDGFADADAARFRLPDVGTQQILRWDARALYAAVDAQREARAMTWKDVANEVGGVTPAMLANLATGGRVAFPGVMRIVGWLGQPAATFTRAANR